MTDIEIADLARTAALNLWKLRKLDEPDDIFQELFRFGKLVKRSIEAEDKIVSFASDKFLMASSPL